MENIDRERFDPVVLSFTEGPMVDRLKKMGIKTHVIYTEKPFDVRKWGIVKDLLQSEGIEMVHAHGTRACSNTLWAARKLGIPVTYTVHGWSFHADQQALVRRIRILGEEYLTSRTALNISVSASNRQSGRDVLKKFESVVISNGINRQKFNPANVFRDIRQELGISRDALVVLFVARVTAHKQPLTLIRAFGEAVKAVPGLHLLMVGDGDEKEEAVRLAAECGLEGKVTFQSFRQDVPDVLNAADIFVLPSLWEGLPIGLLEAMAMGKAVIATDVDGTRELVRDKENGLMSEAGNVSSLAGAIVELAQNGTLREQFGRNARKMVQEEFDSVAMTRKIEDIYLSLYNRRSNL